MLPQGCQALQPGRAHAINSCAYPEVIPSHQKLCLDATAFVAGHLSRRPVYTWALHPACG